MTVTSEASRLHKRACFQNWERVYAHFFVRVIQFQSFFACTRFCVHPAVNCPAPPAKCHLPECEIVSVNSSLKRLSGDCETLCPHSSRCQGLFVRTVLSTPSGSNPASCAIDSPEAGQRAAPRSSNCGYRSTVDRNPFQGAEERFTPIATAHQQFRVACGPCLE